MPIWVKQSWRLFQHELKRGELTIICFAIVLAVATVFSLSGFSEQIKSALISESNSFIASDRVLQSSRPVAPEFLVKARESNITNSQVMVFSSMVFAEDEMLLASIKAVDNAYPLRGELLIQQFSSEQASIKSAPPQGSIWVAQSLLDKMDLAIGDSLEVGVSLFEISGVIDKEPDASFSVFMSGPRVLLNIADIPKTEIVQPGSRITYRYLFAGESDDIAEFETWIKPQVENSQRWYDIKSQQSPLANALTRAEKFLSLASMFGIILAAVAVSVASRRYGQRHQPMVAVFKAMGAPKKHIRNLYILHWTCLSIFAIGLGLLLGSVLQWGALDYMAQYLPKSSQEISFYPVFVAIFTGIICACAFAIAPMKELILTPVLSVIRGFDNNNNSAVWLANGTAFIAVFALLYLFSRDIMLAFILLLSAFVVVSILLGLGYVMFSVGRKIGSGTGKSLHLAMANLKRRAKQNNVQLVSFTMAIMLLLLMLVVRDDLINEWQAQLPENAPNQFLVNVNKQQVPKVEAFLEQHQLNASDLYPIIRGRLTAVNDEKFANSASKEEDDGSDRGRQGIGRELNMTWHMQLPKENEVIKGQWFDPTDPTPQVSVESRVAERLDLKLNDNLTFQIGSEEISLPITSIREVNWQSMQPNFYMIFNEGVLSDFPATHIVSMHLPQENKKDLQSFLMQYPTISLIDVDAMISQLRTVIKQVSLAIEFILALVVIAGSLVLVAQVQASMEERERELAILRTLGAKGSLLRNSTLLEFVVLGAVSGFIASIIMELAVYYVQTKYFEMESSLHLNYWILGTTIGGVFVGLVGLISCWRLLNLTSLTLIRRTL